MTQPPNWSLKKEIRNRETQEILRARQSSLTPTMSRSVPVQSQVSSAPLPERRVTPHPPPPTTRNTRHTIFDLWHSTTRQQRQHFIIAVSAVAVMAVVVVVNLLLNTRPVPQTAALVGLPPAHLPDVMNHLTQAGIPITELRTLTVPNTSWNATEAVQFTVRRETNKGSFVMLGHASAADASIDLFKTTTSSKWSQWTVTQISNILVLAAPGSALTIRAELANQLTAYLVVPYREYLKTTNERK